MISRVSLPGLLIAFMVSFALAADKAPRKPAKLPPVSAQVRYSSGILVTSNKTGTAAIHFTLHRDDGGLDYEFRFRPSDATKQEQQGTGTISPINPKPADRATVKTGMSGENSDDLVAGELALHWGLGSKEWGWVYYWPEEMTVQVVFAEFKELDLARFHK